MSGAKHQVGVQAWKDNTGLLPCPRLWTRAERRWRACGRRWRGEFELTLCIYNGGIQGGLNTAFSRCTIASISIYNTTDASSMSGSTSNAFMDYLFVHSGLNFQTARLVSDVLHLTTEADILQITEAELRTVPGLSEWYRIRILGAAEVYRRGNASAKVGGKGIEGGLNTSMSASVDSSGAALACMRAALENVDLGAQDLGAHGGLETLGARLRVPRPNRETGMYKRAQFRHKDVRTAYDGFLKKPGTEEDKNYENYVQAYQTYQDQDDTVARMARRRAGHADRRTEYAGGPRRVPALRIDDGPEDLAPRLAPRRRAAVSGADKAVLGMVRREHERAGYEGVAKRSRRAGGGAAGGGAYARDAFDSDVREIDGWEAAADERARKRLVLAMDDDWLDMQRMDDWYKG